MSERPTMMIVGSVKKTRFPGNRLAEAQAGVACAVRDFQLAWDCGDVRVTGIGTYAGRPVATVSFDGRDYIVRHESRVQLVVETVKLLQTVGTRGNTQWPTVPGTGPLHPAVRDECAIWETPNGTEFCEIGHLFARSTNTRTPDTST
jgi:hypothetical protein